MLHPHRARVVRAAEALDAHACAVGQRYVRAEGDDGGAIVAVGRESFHEYLFGISRQWRELESVRRVATSAADELVDSMRNNRRIVGGGLHMVSVFSDTDGPPDLLDLLASQDVPYLVGPATLDVKVIDGGRVLLEGPLVDGRRSLMALTDRRTMALTRAYWRAVLGAATTAADLAAGRPSPLDFLTPRQRAVAALLARDASDERAAEVLGVSVRTLRSDIADLKRGLGVTTRFAAGVELGRRRQQGLPARSPGETTLQQPAVPTDEQG